jgi:E3 ubiquitin-protein ligase SIAH1
MEQVVDSIHVPCPHAAHGCTERPVYHDRDAHARACAHKPCHCPGESCGFAGSVQTMLLEHFAAVHGWPCTAGSTGTRGFNVSLRKGFNIVVVTAGATTFTTEQQYTFVLNVEQATPFCNAITPFCIHPCNTGTVRLGLSSCGRGRCRESDLCSTYLQLSRIEVVCTDLSNGMPGPSSCFRFLVPRWSAPGGGDDEDIRVTVTYISGTYTSGSCKHQL